MEFCFIPRGVNLEKILQNNPPPFKWDIDMFNFIIGSITYQKAQKKHKAENDFVPLSAMILQKKARNYTEYLDYLIKHDVIETDNQYIPGQKCKGYTINTASLKGGLKMVGITNKKIRNPAEEKKRLQTLKKNYGYLTQWFNASLQIDKTGAEKTLQLLYIKELKQGRSVAMEKWQYRQMSVDMLTKGIYNLSVDDNVQRFHSVLTNLKSELRKHLTYKGKRLVSVDMRNSHPFISAVLLNRNFYSSESKNHVLLRQISPAKFKEVQKVLPQIITLLPIHSPIILVKSDVTQASTEFERFLTLADKGQIYAYFNDEIGKQTGKKYDLTDPKQKRELKSTVFMTLYSDNRFFGQVEAEPKRVFESLFPTVYKIFALLKKGDKARLAVIMQLIESEIILRRAAKRIVKERGIPIFTIHDSIATVMNSTDIPAENDDNVLFVYQIMKEEFEKAVGLKPSLHIEPWYNE